MVCTQLNKISGKPCGVGKFICISVNIERAVAFGILLLGVLRYWESLDMSGS
jgi:hypothetical protein